MSHEDEKKEQSNKNSMNRRNLLKKGAFFGGVSALISALGITPFTAHAATTTSGQGNLLPQIVPLNAAEKKQYIGMTLASPDYQSFQTQQHSHLQQGFNLSEKDTSAVLVVNGTEKMVVVHVPILGGAGNSYYGEQIQYGTSTVISTMAGLFTTNSDQNIAVQMWKQGKEVINAVITPDGKQFIQGTITPAIGQNQALDSTTTTAEDWGCWYNQLNSCLSGLGVPSWLIGVAATGCSLVCIVTVGSGCIVCLILALGAYTTELQYCNAVAYGECP